MIGKWLKGVFGRRPPDRVEFAQLVMLRLQARYPGDAFSHDVVAFMVRRSSGSDGPLAINLGNIYIDYCNADRAGREEILETFLVSTQTVPMPDSLEEARASLLPVIRCAGSLELLPGEGGVITQTDPYERFGLLPFVGGLAIGIVFDTPCNMVHVGGEQLSRWGLSAQAALEIALDNLRHKTAPQFVATNLGVFISHFEDYYDAARLLLPELAWQLPLKGAPVAMIPNRGCLLLTGEQDEAGLEVLLAIAGKMLEEQSRPLSATMFRLAEQGWAEWVPPGNSGITLQNMQRRMLEADYGAQQTALNAMLEQTGQDIFVATLKLVQKQGNPRIESYAVISRDVPTWVPRTDLLVFNDPDENVVLFVPWRIALETVPDLLEPLAYVLPRFNVRCFPDAAQLAIMQARLAD